MRTDFKPGQHLNSPKRTAVKRVADVNVSFTLYPRCSGRSECEKNIIPAEEIAELEQWQKASKVQPACDYNEEK